MPAVSVYLIFSKFHVSRDAENGLLLTHPTPARRDAPLPYFVSVRINPQRIREVTPPVSLSIPPRSIYEISNIEILFYADVPLARIAENGDYVFAWSKLLGYFLSSEYIGPRRNSHQETFLLRELLGRLI